MIHLVRCRVLLLRLFLAALVLSPTSSAAQVGTASLSGEVTDESGAVVPQALVAVRRSAAGFERRVEIDSAGLFTMSDLAPGDYEVTATSDGFAVAVQRVSMRAGDTRRLRFQLRVGGLTEDVVVVAGEMVGSHERLRRLPGSVDIVDRETLEKSRMMTTNEALREEWRASTCGTKRGSACGRTSGSAG